jgi:hypothetical protein
MTGLIGMISAVAWLKSDAEPFLRSLQVMATEARYVYSLEPIRRRLHRDVDLSAIATWVAAGGRWRIAVVAMERGVLRFVTETGAVVERDGTPVGWKGLSPRCEELRQTVEKRQKAWGLACTEARKAKERPDQDLKTALDEARAAYNACAAAQPEKIPLQVDLRIGVLASATIPALFGTVRMGDENYIDGGVREIVPTQIAVDLGADELYVLCAAPLTSKVQEPGTYNNAGLASQVGRSLLDLTLNEINLDDIRILGGPKKVFVISPDFEVHGMTTIDPGLIQINRDYGYMRAADTLDGVPPTSPESEVYDRWSSATHIAKLRTDIWRSENHRHGQPDPTGSKKPLPIPPGQPELDAAKAKLAQLFEQRRNLGGPLPAGIDRWTRTMELHPWSVGANDAEFVVQTVPASMDVMSRTEVSVAMRNTGATIWRSAEGYSLGSQAPQDNVAWGSNRQALPNDVAPGQDVTFAFTINASARTAQFQWQMVQDGREWFGALTPLVDVVAVEPARCGEIRRELADVEQKIARQVAARRGLNPRRDEERIDEINELLKNLWNEQNILLREKSEIGCH